MGISYKLSSAFRVPLSMILPSFFTVNLSGSIMVVQPSSASCPIEIKLALVRSVKMRAFLAFFESRSDSGR